MTSSRFRAIAGLVAAAVVLGVFTLSPVSAHFSQNTKHLGNHAWKQVIKKKADKRYQKNCRNGAVLAFALVNTDPAFSATFTTDGVVSSFNCKGGAIQARRLATGEYLLRIPGLSNTVGSGAEFIAATNVAETQQGPGGDEKADYFTTTDGTQRVLGVIVGDTQASSDTGNLVLSDDHSFSVIVFGVGGSLSGAAFASTDA